MRALVLNQETYADIGHVGEALARRQIRWDLVFRETADWRSLSSAGYDLLVLLGSMWNPLDEANPAIAAEISLIGTVRSVGVPTLGVCYGAQLMAVAAGGALHELAQPCIGYTDVATPGNTFGSGPQFFWNHVGFSAPPETQILASGPQSCWAFEYPGGVAVQFHLDATPGILDRWTREGAQELASTGVSRDSILATARRVEAHVASTCESALNRLLST